jgi:hypothetical protein
MTDGGMQELKVVREVITDSGPVWGTTVEQGGHLLGWTDLPWEILLKITDDLSLSDILHVQQVRSKPLNILANIPVPCRSCISFSICLNVLSQNSLYGGHFSISKSLILLPLDYSLAASPRLMAARSMSFIGEA